MNFFAIKKTILPNILEVFEYFELFDHLSSIFKNIIKVNENEVFDEYQDVEDLISKYNE